MSEWRDFPDEPGMWWRLTIGYSSDGFHSASGFGVHTVTEVVGDLALSGSSVIARRPDPEWRTKQSAAARAGRGDPSQHFHPYRWLRVVVPDLGRDEHGRIDRKIVWESKP